MSIRTPLGRDPQIGDWCSFCCAEDLHRLDTQAELESALEHARELGGVSFWASRELAAAEVDEACSVKLDRLSKRKEPFRLHPTISMQTSEGWCAKCQQMDLVTRYDNGRAYCDSCRQASAKFSSGAPVAPLLMHSAEAARWAETKKTLEKVLAWQPPGDSHDNEPLELIYTDRNPEHPEAVELGRRTTDVTFFRVIHGARVYYGPIPVGCAFVSLGYGKEIMLYERLTPLQQSQLAVPGVTHSIGGPITIS